MTTLHLHGYAADIKYTPTLSPQLTTYSLDSFNINLAPPFGVITFGQGDQIAYSQWVSPKRTRSYPFARIYNTYHLNSKRVTIIPIIKDEGARGDLDRINFITFSWMNLLNVYIILAWYDSALPHPRRENKITNQLLNADYIRSKIFELSHYQASALHWNTSHFTQDFEPILLKAIESYAHISAITDIPLHPPTRNLRFLERCKQEGVFTIEGFKGATLQSSLRAALRETSTIHKRESLSHGIKAIIEISNYLGGQYFLTVDEVYEENGFFILQESKNSDAGSKLPKPEDVKDGLFKLILFSNLEKLTLEDRALRYAARLCLTGNFSGDLSLPQDADSIIGFCDYNKLNLNEVALIVGLQREVEANKGLSVIFRGHRSEKRGG
jgi:hypothetical protein